MSQSEWSDWVDTHRRPTNRSAAAYTVDVWRLPNCDFRSPDTDELTEWYWRVSLGSMPINGGLTTGPYTGRNKAASAIHQFEWVEFRERHYWDVETGSWCAHGELPPLE